MTPHKHLLDNLTPLTIPFLITLPNEYRVKVISTGSLHLRQDMTLHNVLLVFYFYFNLIFIHKLLSQYKGIAAFTGVCILQIPSLMRPQKISRVANDLYFFRLDASQSIPSFHVPVSNSVLISLVIFFVMLHLL